MWTPRLQTHDRYYGAGSPSLLRGALDEESELEMSTKIPYVYHPHINAYEKLNGDWPGATSDAGEPQAIFSCPLCGALVPDGFRSTHGAWHARLASAVMGNPVAEEL